MPSSPPARSSSSPFGAKPASLDVQKIVLKEIDIRGTIAYVNSHPETIKLVESGKIDLKPFITGKIAVEDPDRQGASTP